MDLYSIDNDIPSMNNIYSSRYWDKVKEDEQKRSNILYEKSKSPYDTGIIAKPAYSDMFARIDTGNAPKANSNNSLVSSLTGEKINKENFSHNNMTPFLRKNVTQNTDVENMSSMLDNKTGNNQFWQNKKEVPCLFKPEMNAGGNVCSMKNNDDFLKSRINNSSRVNNFFPIEKIRVGPGINKGFEAMPSGGFQQMDTTDYAKPRSLDDLRSKINQKQTYFEIPMQAPPKGTEQRSVITPFAKNRPDTNYEVSPDMWLKTTGAITKEAERPAQNIRPTARQEFHIDYKGAAKYGENSPGQGILNDYGKSNIIIYDNERNITGTRNVVSNVSSLVKAIVAPIMDVLKYTMKEYNVEAVRAVGNPSIQIPSKATTYDPVNHIMKTTIKETTIHDSELANLTGNKETYAALNDSAKTTIKETTIHDSELANLTGNKETYSALNDIAKTTIKETMIHDTTIANMKGDKGEGYILFDDDEAKKTLRQTMPKIDSIRNIGGTTYKVSLYNPDLVAKTTMKETMIKGKSEYGFLGGVLEGLFGGYLSTNVELKNTHKQFLSDTNEYGIAGSGVDFRQPDRTADENAEIDGTREGIMMSAGYTPNPSNVNIISDSSEIEMTTKKPFENSIAARDSGNIGMIYQSTPILDNCSITKMPQKSNAYSNRLDSDLLEPMNSNDFAIKINPIKKGCKI
jgi:hypothetical protein|uniref:DUF5899 domain-containing protein n=1 Tax=viral metagenome TaxID=1070528 RepID=A0A6C0IAQ0_9ZZZZ